MARVPVRRPWWEATPQALLPAASALDGGWLVLFGARWPVIISGGWPGCWRSTRCRPGSSARHAGRSASAAAGHGSLLTRSGTGAQGEEWDIDLCHLPALPSLAEPGLLVMDMDSTAIRIECIDEIARLAGVGEQVAAVTAAAMQGQLEFADSLRARVALLEGAPVTLLDQVAVGMPGCRACS